jgi:hypothetical protein
VHAPQEIGVHAHAVQAALRNVGDLVDRSGPRLANSPRLQNWSMRAPPPFGRRSCATSRSGDAAGVRAIQQPGPALGMGGLRIPAEQVAADGRTTSIAPEYATDPARPRLRRIVAGNFAIALGAPDWGQCRPDGAARNRAAAPHFEQTCFCYLKCGRWTATTGCGERDSTIAALTKNSW